MNMIEKVARAIHNYSVKQGVVSPQWENFDNIPKLHKDHLMAVVKVAIETMKEPTPEMLKAAPRSNYIARAIYKYMIIAALKE